MIPEDDDVQRRYWPFDVLPPEQRSEQHEREIRFFETAHREGFHPYLSSPGDFGAAATERGGLILVRGRRRWEVVLGTTDTKIASAFVDDFACAAEAVLQWLRGADTADILSRVQDHLVRLPGAAHSFVLDAVPQTRSC
jgi:hypothetical protein